jgi:hypothetical protein
MKTSRHVPVLVLLVLLLFCLAFAASAGAASQAQIDASITSGVEYLAPLQSTGGAPTGAWPCDEYYPANTGFVVAVLEHYAEHIRKTPLDASYAYHANVQAGLDYLFSAAVYDATNHWVYWDVGGYIDSYQTGPCLMAIARSGAPDAVVSGGTALDGFTYKQVAQMAVDWLASAQATTGTATGGWYYYKGVNASDQSATGWVGMGLGYAAHSMGCTLPADMTTRLSTWNDFIQSDVVGPTFGGAAYTDSYLGWYNVYKTGHLLFNRSLCGDTVATPRVQDALTFMTTHWADPTNGYGSSDDYGWRGDPANGLAPSYIGMATSMKGFTALNIETFNGIDWYHDFSDVIVATQFADGHWVGGGFDEEEAPLRSTCWALLTLLKGSTYIPPQVATNAATSLTGTSATLNGTLEQLGTSTTVSVSLEYGTAPGTYTAETTPLVQTATGAFSANIGGLTPGTTYYFRAKAAGEVVAYGAELSFTTPVPPTVVTNAATSLTGTSATLNGTLEQLGSSTTVDMSFEYGTAPGTYAAATTPLAQTATGAFSADIGGLTPGTTYYFRAKAAGEVVAYGAELSFTTTVPAPLVTPKVTLALSGLKNHVVKLGRSVTAKGKVTPTSLAGSKVKITVQKKIGGKWMKIKSVMRTIRANGAYGWNYKPAKSGTYRMRTTIARTSTHASAATPWRGFRAVKHVVVPDYNG